MILAVRSGRRYLRTLGSSNLCPALSASIVGSERPTSLRRHVSLHVCAIASELRKTFLTASWTSMVQQAYTCFFDCNKVYGKMSDVLGRAFAAFFAIAVFLGG